MILSVTFGRVYNLGNYENLRLEAHASVQDDDVAAAFDEARAAVEAEHAHYRQRLRAALAKLEVARDEESRRYYTLCAAGWKRSVEKLEREIKG